MAHSTCTSRHTAHAHCSTSPHATHPWKPSRGTEMWPLTKRWHHSSYHIWQKKRRIRKQRIPTKTLRPHSKLPLTDTFESCWPIVFDVHHVWGWDTPSPFTTHFSHHFHKGPFYQSLRIGHFLWSMSRSDSRTIVSNSMQGWDTPFQFYHSIWSSMTPRKRCRAISFFQES